ncbi:hypothetical protein BDW22DRAFT_1364566 [Trametopsis cervina]|nr:hypothetical protein BDW22DRAFT_1364566 [Trametopsis cervina]
MQRSFSSASPERSSPRSSTPRPTGGFYVYMFFSNQISFLPTRNHPPEVVAADTWDPQLTDGDDSTVLSDLIQSGEQSRP